MCIVLQFSGGKDSLACLYLLEPRWHEITVAWVNSGAAFPETIALMDRVRKMVPHFLEIEGKQNIEAEGYPTDVLPIAATALGRMYEGHTGMRFQSRYSCCTAALWGPMVRAMREIGATTIIRGQKRSDVMKTPLQSGTVIEGIRYEFPLEDWTDADVLAYLRGKGIELPANYRYMANGLDCINCTAYLHEGKGRLQYMRENHPEKHREVQRVLGALWTTLHEELAPLVGAGSVT